MNRIDGFNREIDPADDFKKWLSEAPMSEEKLICLFEKILKQYKDIQTVKTCAAKVELTTAEFFCDDIIELDLDLRYQDDYLCHIYKTWTDPGFRIARTLPLDKTIPDFKNKFLRIIKICSTNFVSFEPKEEKDGQARLILEIGIFADGFNEKVLRSAVEVLEQSLKRIKAVLEE
jgi:hypothetical protein